MSKVVSLIASYDPHNLYVPVVVSELRKRSKVILFTTDQPTFEVDEVFMYDRSIGKDLVYEPRKWITSNLEADWDYVLYSEDDIFISESVLDVVIKSYKTLPEGLVPGFARYEYLVEDNKRYIDLHPSNSVHRGGSTIVKKLYTELGMWEPWNLHSGNFIFSKNHIQNLIRGDKFEKTFQEYGYRYGNCDQLESAASVLYFTYTKVLPKDVSSVQVHHLPNKYINMPHNYGNACGPGELDIINEYETK